MHLHYLPHQHYYAKRLQKSTVLLLFALTQGYFTEMYMRKVRPSVFFLNNCSENVVVVL